MTEKLHLHLYRNGKMYASYEEAIASYDNADVTNENLDGTPRLARYVKNGKVKTIFGVYANGADDANGHWTIFDTEADMANVSEIKNSLDENTKNDEEYRKSNDSTINALNVEKADKRDMVWAKEENGIVARNTKNQKIAELGDDGSLKLYVEGELLPINDLLGQLAHESYNDETHQSAVVNPTKPEALVADEVIVSGTLDGAAVNDKVAVSAQKDAIVNLAYIESKQLSVKAEENVTVNDLSSEGALAKSISNAGFVVSSKGDVVINGGTIGMDGYNALEIGLANGYEPKNVTIQNLNVDNTLTNNAILVFGVQEGGTITLKNCHFKKVSNVLRFSNKLGVGNVTINVENCTVDEWDANKSWRGFLILEDYTSKTKEECDTANRFSSNKVTVNFKNLVHAGKKLVITKDEACDYENNERVVYKCVDYVSEYGSGANTDLYNEETKDTYPTITFE